MPGYVYLIGSPTFSWYKIGKSITPDTRVKQLGILLPFKMEVIAIWRAENHDELESFLHNKHATSQINGEWFRFNPQQVNKILSEMPQSIESAALKFSNIKRDAPEGKKVIVKFRREDGVLEPGAAMRVKELLAQNKILRRELQALKQAAGSRVPAEEVKYGT